MRGATALAEEKVRLKFRSVVTRTTPMGAFMSRSAFTLTFAVVAVAVATTPTTTAQAAPACDDRIAIDNPVHFPFETTAALRYDNDYNGDFEGRGSGTVVGPHMVLTCGHCVYDRDNGDWNDDDIYIAPAMYQDDTNATVYPFGTRIASEKHTNTKWTDPSYSPESEVDYGSLGFVCPFEELTTYIPLVFDYESGFVISSNRCSWTKKSPR